MIDFAIYKSSLVAFFKSKGVQVNGNPVFCPFHDNTHTPAMLLYEKYFECKSCGAKGDIYDAFELYYPHITNSFEKLKAVKEILGGIDYDSENITMREKQNPHSRSRRTIDYSQANPAVQKLDDYMFHTDSRSEHKILMTLKTRGYTHEQAVLRAPLFGWWYGWTIGENTIGRQTMYNGGIPGVNPLTEESAWSYPGIVMRIAEGWLLTGYDPSGRGFKKYSTAAKVFPAPTFASRLPGPDGTLYLCEGLMDEVSAQLAGIPLFATGGTSGLSQDYITNILLPQNLKKIVIAFDGDTAGWKGAQNVSKKLKKCGFGGIVKIAVLPDGSDPDEMVTDGRVELLKEILKEN